MGDALEGTTALCRPTLPTFFLVPPMSRTQRKPSTVLHVHILPAPTAHCNNTCPSRGQVPPAGLSRPHLISWRRTHLTQLSTMFTSNLHETFNQGRKAIWDEHCPMWSVQCNPQITSLQWEITQLSTPRLCHVLCKKPEAHSLQLCPQHVPRKGEGCDKLLTTTERLYLSFVSSEQNDQVNASEQLWERQNCSTANA